jgi:predicted amidohydrolase YtcJ
VKILLTICLICVPVVAQQIGNPTTQDGVVPPRGVFAIRNARIVTVSGADIENGTVVIRDGKIEAVGTAVNVPAGAQSIDGRGLSVYPGMIDAGTNLDTFALNYGSASAARLYTTGPIPKLPGLGSSLSTAAIPEPASWALMIVGFGAAGAILRRRRGLVAA